MNFQDGFVWKFFLFADVAAFGLAVAEPRFTKAIQAPSEAAEDAARDGASRQPSENVKEQMTPKTFGAGWWTRWPAAR
jgi:hypothetical protein